MGVGEQCSSCFQVLQYFPILNQASLTAIAIWLSFSTMLIFGFETTFRSLRRARFPSRNRWQLPAVVVVISAMIFSGWAATNVFPTKGKCLTGLVWWTARYAKLAVVLASGLLAAYPASATIITVQLVKTVKVDKAERIAATRVVYYLIVNTWLIVCCHLLNFPNHYCLLILLQALILPYYVQILIGTPAMRSAQVAQVALNVSGILNLIMHIFLRSNADRLAIRAVETPWSDKRTIRVFGPSDLNVQEHISYPVLWNEKNLGPRSLTVTSEKASLHSGTESDYDAYSSSGPLQHIVFPSPKAKAYHPSMPSLKVVPMPQITRNNSSYALFPTAESTTAHMSSSTTYENDEGDWELPLPPAPLFAHKYNRITSVESSQTVQIGLRLSYMNHALDPIEASPPSIIGLRMGLETPDAVDRTDWSRPAPTRASASSDTLHSSELLRAQSYRSDTSMIHDVFIEPEALMPDPAEHMPRRILPQQQAERAGGAVLPQQAFNASEQASSRTRRQEPVRVVDLTSHAASTPLQQRASLRQIKKPHPAFPSYPIHRRQRSIPSQNQYSPKTVVDTTGYEVPQPAKRVTVTSPSRPSGLPHSPKPAPSWRPQNWTSPRNHRGLSPASPEDEDKALPSEKALPYVSSGAIAFKSNNPFNNMTPQVIHRPPGWK